MNILIILSIISFRIVKGTHQYISIAGYRTSNNTSPTTSVYCPANPSLSYSLKSIVINNIAASNSVTLSTPDQPNSILNTAQARGTLLVFNNPPIYQCYLFNFPSPNSTDTNNIKVQFIYDSNNDDQGIQRSYGYGNYASPYGSNMYTACGSIICRNGGICQYMGTSGYQCRCDSSGQWLGTDCSKQNPCMQNPCYNGGQCYYLADATYYCICYSGSNCQYSSMTGGQTSMNSYNPCLSSGLCLNGGTCVPSNNQGAYTCLCPQGYAGANCQSLNSFVSPSSVSTNDCGVSPLEFDRIVNGESVRDHTWPWLVSIQIMYSSQHFCGGTLIDAYHVITASHCFEQTGTSPNMFKIVAGLLNLRQTSSAGVQQLGVQQIFRHEGFSATGLVNDITLIRLSTPAQFTDAVRPICLPDASSSQDPVTGQSVRIAGWGYTDSATKQLADQLQQATIQILDLNGDLYGGPGCNAWLRRGYALTNNKQICAMSRDTRTDSCQGDSGGPLISDIKSRWYLFGIVSFGDAVCASSTAAGVYTRVSAFIPWIQQKLQL